MVKRKHIQISILFLSSLILFACEEEKARLSESKGQPAELLVVLPANLQHTAVADTLTTIVDCDAPGLASSEHIFRTMTIGTKGYEKVYKLMHSQLHVEIDPQQKEPAMGVAYDVYAIPQLQVLVKGATTEALCQYLSENRERIQRLILDFQLDRQARLLQRKYSKKVCDELGRLGYSAYVPVDIASTKKGKHFLWGSSNRGGDKDINFVFYTYPWAGEDIADTALFVAKRDSVMKANIPGSQPDQWMTTTRGQQGQPVVWAALRKIGNKAQFEVRGLWEMKDGYMGGPFVSLARIDTAEAQVVVAEGFVFSPNSSKRDLLRSVEAGLRTLVKQ